MTAATRRSGWQGWPDAAGRESEWTDLTHTISADVPRLRKFAPPSVEQMSSMPDQPFSVTRLDIVCHTGTHVDAPCHFIEGAPGIDEIPLQRLHGPAVVVRVDVGAGGEVGADELARSGAAPATSSSWTPAGGVRAAETATMPACLKTPPAGSSNVR